MLGQLSARLETKKAIHCAAESAATAINLLRKNMSNFKTWTQENLAAFAQQANEKMIQQNDRIEQLQCDLKDAIEAYRALMRKVESQRGQ
jgi:hypothetical protein